MKLSNISYRSATFFGVFVFIMYLIAGILQYAYIQNTVLSQVQTFIVIPLVAGIVTWVFMLLAVAVYNFLATKGYGISWSVKK